jgi:L-arabinose isomerase
MRNVAVTEGDKVHAERDLGFAINTWSIGDVVEVANEASDADVTSLVERYLDEYDVVAELRPGGERESSLRDEARIEIGLRRFLEAGGFTAFTDTFEDLHGLPQLPGLAVQRLMAEGYGFAGEGDWKTAAMVRAMKVMTAGLEGGVSFMEDYTYHLSGENELVLGAHMLEVCPSIASGMPRLEIHPLSIGGKADPVRLVFDAHTGPAIAACITDMGSRFRMVAAVVDVVSPQEPMPKLPVARAVWQPRPDLRTSATAWIYAGGSHHTSLGYAVTLDQLRDFSGMSGIEFLVIDEQTKLADFRDEVRRSDLFWNLARGL